MKMFLLLPLLIPFLTAIVSLLVWKRRLQRIFGVIGATGLLGSAIWLLIIVCEEGIQAVQIGDWPAPFGITLAADVFTGIMVVMAGLMGLVVTVYSLASMDARRESFGYYPLIHIMLMGVCGSFLTGDIFNLYVWFEVMLIASFVLMGLGGEKAQLEGTIKYVTINLVSSALFLTAVGVLYGMVGTLNMADLANRLTELESPGLVTSAFFLLFLAFGIKAAVFPLFFWLPASYHTPPVSVSAIFAALLTKVGVYAIIRIFTLVFTAQTGATRGLILVVAGLTMVTGVLGAVAQGEFRRLLSFHIVSQIGYMIMGLGFFTALGLAGSIFHIVHNMLAKTNLFLVSGVVHRLKGTYTLSSLGGLSRSSPGLAILFLVSAFSLAGMPPLSGFWSKLILVQAGLQAREYTIVAVSLAVSLLTLYSMTKIWHEVFWKEAPMEQAQEPPEADSSHGTESSLLLLVPIVVIGVVIISVGFAAQPVFALFEKAAHQLMNPSEYIHAVLGGAP